MTDRWPVTKAQQWHAAQPWLVGCNYVPSSAVNDVEMWQEATFDLETIGRELGWARDAGLNSVRVFLDYVVWDLYNEPGSSGMGEGSGPLLEAAFAWAREAGSDQPLTAAAWDDCSGPMSQRMMELSEVVSFHGYEPPEQLRKKLALCGRLGRPILCTEWLRRQVGNTVEAILPLFRNGKVGCYHWGLVAGRTRTYLHWGSKAGSPTPEIWQHDLFHTDGRPYREKEIRLFQC